MPLDKNLREATAFTILGYGSFQYTRAPFCLLCCPVSFSRLMAMVTRNLSKTEAYIDEVLVHSAKTIRKHAENRGLPQADNQIQFKMEYFEM